MELSLLVCVRGPMCLDALVVGAGVGTAPAVVGPGLLNMSNNGHRLTSPKATSDVVLPSDELVSWGKLGIYDGPVWSWTEPTSGWLWTPTVCWLLSCSCILRPIHHTLTVTSLTPIPAPSARHVLAHLDDRSSLQVGEDSMLLIMRKAPRLPAPHIDCMR
jgi:hypothetical protein